MSPPRSDRRQLSCRWCDETLRAGLRGAIANIVSGAERMKPDVAPDFFWVIDAHRLDQEFAEIFVLGERFVRVRNSGAGKALDHFPAITLEPGVLPGPERRVDR